MPIRIEHSPVGTLMNLARSAGEAQGARESAAHDLAFTQMALQAQTQNAQIGASIQKNNQAFQLQQAALQRQTRTPTRAVAGATPVTQEIDKVLGRMTTTREWGQEDQAAQLQQLERIPDLSERERESIKLGIMGGQSLTQLLKERTTPKPAQTELSFGQKESRLRVIHQNQRDVWESRLRALDEERMLENWTPDLNKWQTRRDEAVEAIKVLDTKYAQMGATQSGEATSTGLNLEVLNKPQTLPATKADAVVGQVYVHGSKLVRWNGTNFTEIIN